mmetsp:Transcript_15043/g.31023  ORF Transcript_15043/g.31023 Transcript_15043/m.31023 type:complete len:391 (-) Transcript_15043:87-1259(-)
MRIIRSDSSSQAWLLSLSLLAQCLELSCCFGVNPLAPRPPAALQYQRDATVQQQQPEAQPPVKNPALQAFNETLLAAGRNMEAPMVQQALERLCDTYQGRDARFSTDALAYQGDWLLETLPTFPGLLGYNEDGDALYTMGRLTYNMIQPGNAVCSVQRMTQHIAPLDLQTTSLNDLAIPASLRLEVAQDPSQLRVVRNDVHFTVEENGVQGVLQMDGFTIPNPNEPNRYSIWFTGGRCYAAPGQDTAQKWRQVFGTELPQLNQWEQFQLWMAKVLMGAEPSQGLQQDGSLSYVLKKPIGGHDSAYQQVLYLDDSYRVTVGNKGSIVVVSRLPETQAAAATSDLVQTMWRSASSAQDRHAAATNQVKRRICSETLRYQRRVYLDTLRFKIS